MDTFLIGTLEGLSTLRSGNETLLLTTLVPTTALDPDTHPMNNLREHEGQVAVVRGTRRGDVLCEAEVLEILPPVASGITRNLIAEGMLSLADLQNRAERAFTLITGNLLPLPPLPPDPVPAGVDLKTCALVVGHRPGAKGASSTEPMRVDEFDYNNALAPMIQARVTQADVLVVLRDDNQQGYNRLPGKINNHKPDFIVSLHCNAFSSSAAHGTEMLYFHKSTKGHKMAKVLQRHVVAALGLKNRFTKAKTVNDRGGHLLKHTNAPCVICEPFFMSNLNDMQTALDRRNELAAAYAAAIDEIATTLT